MYQQRKDLADALELKGIDVDALNNAAKSERRTVYGLMGSIDRGLNEGSGGEWGRYLREYQEGMRPISEGRVFQDLLDQYSTAGRLSDGVTPNITPHSFRKMVSEKKQTYKNLGKSGWADRVSPEGREFLIQARRSLDALERAKNGPKATNGSDTASNLYESLLRPVLAESGSGKIGMLMRLVDNTRLRGNQANLDRALLDPEEFDRVLKQYHKMTEPQKKNAIADLLYRSVERLPLVIR